MIRRSQCTQRAALVEVGLWQKGHWRGVGFTEEPTNLILHEDSVARSSKTLRVGYPDCPVQRL